jgi:hypothetical protein
MRRGLATVAIAGACLGGAIPTAHADLRGRLESAVTPGHRCPKLSEPIECRDRRGHDAGNQDHFHSFLTHHDRDERRKYRCNFYRVTYIGHHPTGKPASLRAYSGCDLWQRDYAFHIPLERLGFGVQEQEGLELARALLNEIIRYEGSH